MIATLYYLFLFTALSAFVALLPDAAPLPGFISTAIEQVNGAISLLGFFFPFDTLFQILAVGLGIEAAIWLFRWANWLFNKIRGSG
jgi:hypothetical protein